MISGPDGLQASHMAFENVGKLKTQKDLEDANGHEPPGTQSWTLKRYSCDFKTANTYGGEHGVLNKSFWY